MAKKAQEETWGDLSFRSSARRMRALVKSATKEQALERALPELEISESDRFSVGQGT